MEELPGPDAFPMDLPAIIANFYSRAGFVFLNNGQSGSITFLGTVSPAGGNLKEPVTESTKKAARAFYALSQTRSDSKRYPAVDPIDSYSKYLEYQEVIDHLDSAIEPGWVGTVLRLKDVLLKGREARDQIHILGDDSVPLEYHVAYNKSEVIDFTILQQDAFDPVDASTPLRRQQYMVNKVLAICATQFSFQDFEQVDAYFKRINNILRQMNYQEYLCPHFKDLESQLETVLVERRV
jgi:V/A-type H+-transporting ATPase subunit A